MSSADWAQVFADTPKRQELSFRRKQDDNDFLIRLEFGWKDGGLTLPPGLLQGQNARRLLDRATLRGFRAKTFDDLPIPFRCVAADLADGSKVVFASGDLADAMRASMSIPGVFAPAIVDGRRLVDGGIVENLPVSVAKSLGADIVIAIDVGTPLSSVEQLSSLLGVTDQVAGIMMQQNQNQSRKLIDDDDVLLTVPLENVTTMGFDLYDEAMGEGHTAAETIAPRLASLGVDDATWQAWLKRQRHEFVPPRIDRIVIKNHSALGDDVLRDRITQKTGEPLDADQLDRDMGKLTELKTFDNVRYEVDPVETGSGPDEELNELVVEATERSWGPNYFRFGLGLASDFRGDNDFDIAVRHTLRPVNALGGEWRNDLRVGSQNLLRSEFYQPLDPSLSWFVAPSIEAQKRSFTFIEEGRTLFDADAFWVQGNFLVGRVLGNWGEIRIGYSRLDGSAKPDLGLLGDLPRFEFQDGYVSARLTIDTLDSFAFPHRGFYSVAEVRYGSDPLGAGDEYALGELNMAWPQTFGRMTILPRLVIGSEFEPGAEALQAFTLGGFLQLSGLRPDELIGSQAAFAALIGYYRLSKPATRFSNSFYLGGSIETGATWFSKSEISASDLRLAGSVFLGIDSLIGPIYTAFGAAEGSNYAAYFYLGTAF